MHMNIHSICYILYRAESWNMIVFVEWVVVDGMVVFWGVLTVKNWEERDKKGRYETETATKSLQLQY